MSRSAKKRVLGCGVLVALVVGASACGGVGQEPASSQRGGSVVEESPEQRDRSLSLSGARYLLSLPLARSNDGAAANASANASASEPPPGSSAPTSEDSPPAAAVPAPIAKEKSSLLPSGFYNPMPGGVFAGYKADTGLDIAGSPRPVYAIQSGTLDYSEPGHTLWTGPKDTANCVRFKLDAPIPWKGRAITHVYYAHLSKLEYSQAEGATARQRIEAGERLGVSGVANHSPHLHIGLLLDGEVEQYWGTFLIEDEVREVLGGYRNGARLPRE